MASRRIWFPVTAGAMCLLWALAGWLTVIPDADRLADGIQVQSLLRSPHLVLAFPGQTHGGVLEYPILLLAEWLAPGNYFAHSAARVVLAFFTGFFAARLFLRLFPAAPRWSFLAAVAAGPYVMHTMTGPQNNPVGVMWIHANYPQSWLLVTMGVSLLADAVARTEPVRAWRLLLPGLLIGLGVYEQPGVLVLAIPLIVVLMLAFPQRVRVWVIAASGSVVGAALMVASFLLHHRQSVYNPAHLPVPNPSGTLEVLGLDGIPSYVTAILPAALGFAPLDGSPIQRVAAVLVPVFVVAILVTAVVSGVRSWRGRKASSAFMISIAWVIAMLGMVAMSWTLSPVWFYGACLGVLLWLTIGVLPDLLPRPAGAIAAGACVLLLAVSTLAQSIPWYRDAPARVSAKVERMQDMGGLADALVDGGATNVFGSYHDVLPLAYAAGGRLHPSAIYYDRFPLAPDAADTQHVFVNLQPTEYHGDDALALVLEECIDQEQVVTTGGYEYGLFACPVDVVSPKR